jgi:hypothetical protein
MKKHTKSDPIYRKTLPKAAMGTKIELGQRGAMDGASLMELRSVWGDAYCEIAGE